MNMRNVAILAALLLPLVNDCTFDRRAVARPPVVLPMLIP